jgi:uncharacterized protein YfaA (DUF2138 family)
MINKNNEGYCLIKVPRSMVLPTKMACEVFALLAQAEAVESRYKDGTTVYKRDNDTYAMPTLEMFPLTKYASMALEED